MSSWFTEGIGSYLAHLSTLPGGLITYTITSINLITLPTEIFQHFYSYSHQNGGGYNDFYSIHSSTDIIWEILNNWDDEYTTYHLTSDPGDDSSSPYPTRITDPDEIRDIYDSYGIDGFSERIPTPEYDEDDDTYPHYPTLDMTFNRGYLPFIMIFLLLTFLITLI